MPADNSEWMPAWAITRNASRKQVAKATEYRLQLYVVEEKPVHTQTYLPLTPRTQATALCLGTLPPDQQTALGRELSPGRTLGWKVLALDAQGRSVGQSHERRFLTIAESLAD